MDELLHWKMIQSLTAQEAGLLIAGVDPYNKEATSKEVARGLVYERAIREAVERATRFAWMYVRGKTEFEMPFCVDIWEMEQDFFQYLPSLEMRNSVAEVLKDPVNVPILIPVDPWFSATVYAGDLTTWLEGNEVKSAYEFDGGQRVAVTPLEGNWYAKALAGENAEVIKLSTSIRVDENNTDSTSLGKRPLSPAEWRARVLDIVKRHGGNKTKAAAELGITRQRVGQLLGKTVDVDLKRKPLAFSPQDPFGLVRRSKSQ